MIKNRNLLSSLFWMGFGIIFVIGAFKYGVIRKGIPYAGFFPLICGITLIVLSLVVLISTICSKKEGEEIKEKGKIFPERDRLKKVVLALIALFSFGFILKFAGGALATFIFMVIIFRLIEPKRWRTVFILALSTTIFTYVLFVVLLEVPLPIGILGY